MKPNDNYKPESYVIHQNDLWIKYLETFFFKIMSHSPELDENRLEYSNDGFKYDLTENEINFYQNQYVQLSEIIQRNPYSLIYKSFNDDNIEISMRDKELYDFIFDIPQRKLAYLGNVGWGKTTHLKYFFFFLLQKCPKAVESLKPIFIGIHKEIGIATNNYNEIEFLNYFKNEILIPRINKLCEEIIDIDNEKFWQYISRFPEFSIYRSKVKNIGKIYTKLEKKDNEIHKLRFKILDEKGGLSLYALKYLLEVEKKNPIIIIDDTDLMSSFHIKVILEELHRMTQKFSIKIIFAARPCTYSAVFDTYVNLKRVINPVKLELNIPLLTQILGAKRKLIEKYRDEHKGQKIEIYNEIIDYDKALDFLIAMIDKSLKDTNQTFITSISDGDIRKFSRMLRVYFNSDYINFNSLFLKVVKGEVPFDRVPDWIVYIPIITNNHKTYFSSKDKVYSEEFVNNIFSNNHYSRESMLIKMHLLNRLCGEDYLRLKSLRKEYLLFYKQNQQESITKAFDHAVMSLINAHLINSRDFYSIEDIALLEKIEEISIEPAGRYYITNLIFNFEYLVYIKDDIYYTENIHIKDAIKTHGFRDRFSSLIEFIRYFHLQELNFLSKLNKKVLFNYSTNYALNSEKLFYSLEIAERIKAYAEKKSIDNLPLHLYRDLIQDIRTSNTHFINENTQL